MFTPFRTLGKGNLFWVWLDEGSKALVIRRQFDNMVIDKTLPWAQVSAIDRYLGGQADWVRLANNVSRLRTGTEGEGLGRFLYNDLGWDTTEAQLASHLAALFVHCGWCELAHPVKRRPILFRKTARPADGPTLYETLATCLRPNPAGQPTHPAENIRLRKRISPR